MHHFIIFTQRVKCTMGPFDYIQKKGSEALKPQPANIRKEISRKALPLTPQPSNSRIVRPVSNNAGQSNLAVLRPSKPRGERPRKRRFSLHPRLESDSDEKDSNETSETPSKRSRVSASVESDYDRQVRCKKTFMEVEKQTHNMVHAASIATLAQPTKYKAAFPNDSHADEISLQYPSEAIKER